MPVKAVRTQGQASFASSCCSASASLSCDVPHKTTTGFSGADCGIINDPPALLAPSLRFYSLDSSFYYGAPLDLTSSTSSTADNGNFYINKADTRVEFEWTHQFTPSGAFINHYQHVVNDWISGHQIGVSEVRRCHYRSLVASVVHPSRTASLLSLSHQAVFFIQGSSSTPAYNWRIGGSAPTRDAPHRSPVAGIEADFEPNQIGITHGRIARFQLRVSNGGYRDVRHLNAQNSASRSTTRRYLQGRSAYATINVVYDFVPPYQSTQAAQLSITAPDLFSASTTQGLSTSRTLTVDFGAYSDDNAPVSFYEVEACPMKLGVPILTEQRGDRPDETPYCLDLAIYEKSNPHTDGDQPVPGPTSWTVTDDGDTATLWSFVLVVKDAADNVRKARRLVIVDTDPQVTVSDRNTILITSAGDNGVIPFEARELWQTSNQGYNATWSGVFSDHRTSHWLSPITRDGVSDLTSAYDQPDSFAVPVAGTPNEDGAVAFYSHLECLDCDYTAEGDDAATEAILNNASPMSLDADTGRPPLRLQVPGSSVLLENGHHYQLHVRADNIFGATTRTASLPFGVDVTPPDVGDFHIFRDGETGLTAHSLNDLQKAQLIFRATDTESGLRHIEWDLYAHQQLSPGEQEASTLVANAAVDVLPANATECAAHGAHACVCNAFSSKYCYLRDYIFPLERHIVLADSELDRHNRNFTFHLHVTNRAGLLTTMTHEIIVDVTPPDASAAAVHEGPGGEGAPDVDYVQDASIPLRFEGFVDPESNIRAVLWQAGPTCVQDGALEAALAGNFTRATGTSALFVAPAPGSYVITAIAFNGAWEPSVPVCSDGVTYDPTPAELDEISVGDLGATPGLIQVPWEDDEGSDVWLIYANLTSAKVEGPDGACQDAATALTIVPTALFPPAYANASVPAATACARYAPFKEQFTLGVAGIVNVSWVPSHAIETIHSTAVALASSPDASQGDLSPFASTHKQTNSLLLGDGAEDGSVFFVMLRLVKKNKRAAVFRIGPIYVDSAPPLVSENTPNFGNSSSPVPGNASATVTVTHHRFTLEARWPSAQPQQQNTAENGALYYRIGAGRANDDSAPADALLPFRQVLANEASFDGDAPGALRGNCSGDGGSAMPCARLPLASLRGLGPYVIVVEACTGNDRCSQFTSTPQPAVPDAAPHAGVVLEGEVAADAIVAVAVAGPDAAYVATLDTEPHAPDADVQLASHALSVRWHGFDTAAEAVSYELGVGSAPGLDDLVPFAPVRVRLSPTQAAAMSASPPLQAYIPMELEAGRRYFPTVRAHNALGSVAVGSDGVVFVPLSASPLLSVVMGAGPDGDEGAGLLPAEGVNITAGINAGSSAAASHVMLPQVTFQPGRTYQGSVVLDTSAETALVQLSMGAFSALLVLNGDGALSQAERCCCWPHATQSGAAAEGATMDDGGDSTCAPGAEATGLAHGESGCACPVDAGQGALVAALEAGSAYSFDVTATAPHMSMEVLTWGDSEGTVNVTLASLSLQRSAVRVVHVDAAGVATRGPVEAAWAFHGDAADGLEAAAQSSVTHFEWAPAIVQADAACPHNLSRVAAWAPQLANLSSSCAPMLLGEFTDVGHAFRASTPARVAMPEGVATDSDGAAVVALVRPCHVAGCFAPSMSAAAFLTQADGPVAQGVPRVSYSQTVDHDGTTEAHVVIPRFKYAGSIVLYQWTLAHDAAGGGQLVDWQTVPRARRVAAEEGTGVVMDYADLPLDLSLFDHRTVHVIARAFAADGTEGRASGVARASTPLPPRFQVGVLDVAARAAREVENLAADAAAASATINAQARLASTPPLDHAYVEASAGALGAQWPLLWQLYDAVSYNWSIAEERRFLECGDEGALACGSTYARAASARDLTLTVGHTYYFCVRAGQRRDVADTDRAVNAGGVAANATGARRPAPDTSCSNGIRAIASGGPEAGAVSLGHHQEGHSNMYNAAGLRVQSAQFQSEADRLDIRWGGFTVEGAETSEAGHIRTYVDNGILRYRFSVGTAPGLADVAGPMTVGAAVTSVHLRNLTLHGGASVVASVVAEDHFGGEAVAYSAPLRIDPSPPVPGQVELQQRPCRDGRRLADADDDAHDCVLVSVAWSAFADAESGVAACSWALGSAGHRADLAGFETAGYARSGEREVYARQGHSLVATVRCANRAGLFSEAVSAPHVVASAPPSDGWVHDGPHSGYDVDFQTQTDEIWARWGGFAARGGDGAIASYAWGVGSRPGSFDLLAQRNVAQQRAGHVSGLALTPGQRYYVTVTACTLVGMCRSVTSDGIVADPSPPAPGVVLDGGHGVDQDMQAYAGAISASWPGFHDQESSIAGYRWCVGFAPATCDVKPFRFVGMATRASAADVVVGAAPLFVTVQAVNGAGLVTQAVSDGIAYDDAAPVVVEAPHFVPEGTVAGAAFSVDGFDHQLSRNVLRMRWRFADAGGRALRYWYTVDTHHDGATVVVDAVGLEDGAVLANLDLREGDALYLQVTACDEAGRCTRAAAARPLLVESSAPTPGRFVDAMSWYANDSVGLVWEHFSDPHTSIVAYDVEVGTMFGTDDIVPATRLAPTAAAAHINVTAPGGSAGREAVLLSTAATPQPGMLLHLAVWGVNSVGLVSRVLAAEARVMAGPDEAGGVLQLIYHQCESIYCDQRCNCGPFGICPLSDGPVAAAASQGDCQALRGAAAAAAVPNLLFGDGQGEASGGGDDLDLQSDVHVLAAHWNGTAAAGRRVQYMAGYAGREPGAGVFDVSAPERDTWYEGVGSRGMALFVTSTALPLAHGQRYVFYLRVWLDLTTFAEFVTDGVEIDAEGPFAGSGSVAEGLVPTGDSEVDFTSNSTTLTVSWTDAFGAEEDIVGYDWAIGTFPGASNTHPLTRVAAGVNVVTPSDLTLVPGKVYYAVVRAVDGAGLTHWRVSDGVVVDPTPPETGVVVDGLGDGTVDVDVAAGGFADVRASWQGFVDLESGIAEYEVAVGLDDGAVDAILPWQSVGGNTSVILPLEADAAMLIGEGSRVRVAVRAINGNGGTSGVAQSDGVIADATPPVSMACSADAGQANLIRDAGFENPVDTLVDVSRVGGSCGAGAEAAADTPSQLLLRAADARRRPAAASVRWVCEAGPVEFEYATTTTAPEMVVNTTTASLGNSSVATNGTILPTASSNGTAPATSNTTSTSTTTTSTAAPPVVLTSVHQFQCRPANVDTDVAVAALPGIRCSFVDGSLACSGAESVAVEALGAANATAHNETAAARNETGVALPCALGELAEDGFVCGIASKTQLGNATRLDVASVTCSVAVNATSGMPMGVSCGMATVEEPTAAVTVRVPLRDASSPVRLQSVSVVCQAAQASKPGAVHAEVLNADGTLVARSAAVACPPASAAAPKAVSMDFALALPNALPLLGTSGSAELRLVAERGEVVLRASARPAAGCTLAELGFAYSGTVTAAAVLSDVALPEIELRVITEAEGVWSATAGRVVANNVNVAVGRSVFRLPPRARLTQDVAVEASQTYEIDFYVRLAPEDRLANVRAQGLRLRLGDVSHLTTVTDGGRDTTDIDELHAWHHLVYHVSTGSAAAGPLRVSVETLAVHSEHTSLEIASPRLRACAAFDAAGAAGDALGVGLGASFHSGVGPLTVTWRVGDEESGVSRLLLAAGTSEGGAQLLDFVAVDAATGRAEAHGLHMPHNSQVWVQLVADNAAGLRSHFRGLPVRVDRTPADIANVTVPLWLKQSSGQLAATWSVRDGESGVSWCHVGLGSAPGMDDLVPFAAAASLGAEGGSHAFPTANAAWLVDRARVHVAVRCGNGAGLVAAAAETQGTLLLLSRPSTAAAAVAVAPLRGESGAASPYDALVGVQTSRRMVAATWTGFGDVQGHLAGFEARLVGPGVDIGPIDMGLKQEVRFTDLSMQDEGRYRVEVTARDIAGQKSDVVRGEVTVFAAAPRVANAGALCAEFVGDPASATTSLVIGWAGVFDTFGCELVGLEADACARYYVDVGRFEHGRDVARLGPEQRGGGSSQNRLSIENRRLVRTRNLAALDVTASYYVTLTAVGASGVPTTISLQTSGALKKCQ